MALPIHGISLLTRSKMKKRPIIFITHSLGGIVLKNVRFLEAGEKSHMLTDIGTHSFPHDSQGRFLGTPPIDQTVNLCYYVHGNPPSRWPEGPFGQSTRKCGIGSDED